MFKFNNNHIFTGYIKELLSEFNLPKIRVYTEKNRKYKEDTGKEKDIIYTVSTETKSEHVRYVSYIKDGQLQQCFREYIDGEHKQYKEWWENSLVLDASGNKKNMLIDTYYYNMPIDNLTKHLRINSNVYDSYTHEYLGDYLRFVRDYKNIDLMPLYNCFSNRVCTSLNLKLTWQREDQNESTKTVTRTTTFDATDTKYKVYMLPVKLFNEYTIAIDSESPIELCCGIYGKYQDTREKFDGLYERTYQKINRLQFNSPVVYSKLTTLVDLLKEDNAMELAQNEDDLKLFIKLPATNNSSIVVLEGNYSDYNDSLLRYNKKGNIETWDKSSNKFITNYENFDDQYNIFRPITQLQLLSINTGTSYPFADRLVEYLVGQAIISNKIALDDTETAVDSDNITRAQTVVFENNNPVGFAGAWDDRLRRIFYDYMQNNISTVAKEQNHDILGYIDKDVEKFYKSLHKVTQSDIDAGKYDAKYLGKLVTKNTLLNVDIYEEQTEFINGGE